MPGICFHQKHFSKLHRYTAFWTYARFFSGTFFFVFRYFRNAVNTPRLTMNLTDTRTRFRESFFLTEGTVARSSDSAVKEIMASRANHLDTLDFIGRYNRKVPRALFTLDLLFAWEFWSRNRVNSFFVSIFFSDLTSTCCKTHSSCFECDKIFRGSNLVCLFMKIISTYLP